MTCSSTKSVRVERVLFVYDAAEAWATFWHDLSKIYACARVTNEADIGAFKYTPRILYVITMRERE